MKDITETLRIMADNIDATRPEYDYSLAHKRIDDADIAALREAADLIDALRKANAEVFETGIKSVRAHAERAIELREVKRERDEARQSCCELAAIVAGADDTSNIESGRFHEIAMQYMRDRGWNCFKEGDK